MRFHQAASDGQPSPCPAESADLEARSNTRLRSSSGMPVPRSLTVKSIQPGSVGSMWWLLAPTRPTAPSAMPGAPWPVPRPEGQVNQAETKQQRHQWQQAGCRKPTRSPGSVHLGQNSWRRRGAAGLAGSRQRLRLRGPCVEPEKGSSAPDRKDEQPNEKCSSDRAVPHSLQGFPLRSAVGLTEECGGILGGWRRSRGGLDRQLQSRAAAARVRMHT